MTAELRRRSFAMACALGVHHLMRRLNRRRLLIVCYHGVASEGDPRDWLLMPARAFEQQLAYLAGHYRVLPIDQALRELRDGVLRSPTACVTFDDGYLDNLTEALPRLVRTGIPATVYLATGLIGTPRVLWTTELDLAFRASKAGRVSADGLLPPTELPAQPADRSALAARVRARSKELPVRDRRRLHGMLLSALGAVSPDATRPFRIMSWDDVRRMEESGLITFGGHTVNHEIVARLDDAELREEIAGSMQAVRSHAARVSDTFAYPNGRPSDFDDRAAAVIRAAGGLAAVSTIEGLNDADTDPFALRRVTVGGGISLDEFRLRTAGVRRPRLRGAAG